MRTKKKKMLRKSKGERDIGVYGVYWYLLTTCSVTTASARTVMPRDNPWSHTDAPPAREEGKLEDWHFDILGVNSDASDAQVRKAYKEVILRFHPDKTGNADVAKQLNEVKTKLLDQEKRAEYTREGR